MLGMVQEICDTMIPRTPSSGQLLLRVVWKALWGNILNSLPSPLSLLGTAVTKREAGFEDSYLCIGPCCSVASSGTGHHGFPMESVACTKKRGRGVRAVNGHMYLIPSLCCPQHYKKRSLFYSHLIFLKLLGPPPHPKKLPLGSPSTMVLFSRAEQRAAKVGKSLWLWPRSPLLPCSEVPSGDGCCHI